MTQYNNNNNGGNNNGAKNNAHYSNMAIGTIKGNLAADPVVEYVEKNKATKVSARILVNKKDGGVDSWNIVEYKNDNAEFASANFRALAEFLKKGRSITVTGEIAQNSRNNNGTYTYFLQIKPIPGGIIMDGGAPEGGGQSSNQNQGTNTFGQQNQGGGNFGGQQQGNFGGQPQGGQQQMGQQQQGGFANQQGNFGGQQQGGFPNQQGNFGGQQQGGQQQGGFPNQQGNFGGATTGGAFAGAGAPGGQMPQGGPGGNFGR